MFLYILKLSKYNCIKIGVASNNNRIVKHIENYKDVDLGNSYKVTSSDENTLKILEKQILNDYIDFSKYIPSLYQVDGYTEIRDICILEDLISDIKYKKNRFPKKELKIIKGIRIDSLKIYKSNKKPVPRFNSEVLKIPNSIIINTSISMYKNDDGDLLNDYDLTVLIAILNMCKYNGKNEVEFYYNSLIKFLGYSDRNGQLKRKILKSISKMNKLSIKVNEANCRIIEKITLSNNVTKIQISEGIIGELKNNNYKSVNKDLYLKCTHSISRRLILILEYYSLLNIGLEYEYLYKLIPLLDKTDYYNKRRLMESVLELKEFGFIDSYDRKKECIKISK